MNGLVEIGGESGYLLAGEIAGTVCFVPGECVHFAVDGDASVDELAYFLSGWSVRNLRWSDEWLAGTHLFPDPEHPIHDQASPVVEQFLRRIRSARCYDGGSV